jgi:hypothetical protein
MELLFESRTLRDSMCQQVQLEREHGDDAKRISQRLQQLRAVRNLADMTHLGVTCAAAPKFGRHHIAVPASPARRLILRPHDHPPSQLDENGSLDLATVTAAVVVHLDVDRGQAKEPS